MNTQNQSLLDFLFYRILKRYCWNSLRNSSKSFVALTSMKNLKWTLTLSTWLCRKKTRQTFYYPKKETSKTQCVWETAQNNSLQTHTDIYFAISSATHIRNMIRGDQESLRKILVAQKDCVYAKKRISAMVERSKE